MSRFCLFRFFLVLGLSLFSVPVFAGGTVKGKVLYDGSAPARGKLTVPGKLAKECGHVKETQVPANDLIVSASGGIKDVVISLTRKGMKPKPIKAVFDQKGCMFVEPVLVVPAGSTVELSNGDPTNHNIRTACVKNRPINVNLAPGEKRDYALKSSESFQVNCDLHPWMKAFISVVKTNHYALTNANGEFEIKDVPPGKYTFKAWHPVLGRAKVEETNLGSKKITVEDGKTIEVLIKKKGK